MTENLLNRPKYPPNTASKNYCKDCKFWTAVEHKEGWGVCANSKACYLMKQIPYAVKGTIQYHVKEDGTVLTEQHYGCSLFESKD